jgi:glucosylceramidase
MSGNNGFTPAELNYVNLADDANVTAQPVLTAPLAAVAADDAAETVFVDLEQVIHPNLTGIGGAFNEIGGDAFVKLSAEKQKELAEALFNPETGSGLTLCRTAIGASDFGLSEYSYSEVADDYEMKHFSIDRDVPTVIAFINAAQAENEDLSIFASPWSPPAWMKKSGSMDGGNKDKENNVLKSDPKIYEAYALYFKKYVQEYAKHGIEIERLIIQNEPDMNPGYPGCDMLPEQMAELTFDYIQPVFDDAGLTTELWAGTFRAMRKDAEKFVTINGAEAIDGIGLQYCRPATFKALHEKAPSMPLMHTEGRCENGKNTMRQARARLGEVAMWFNNGTENYCYWNIVLNETTSSAWDWKQNSLIQIDRDAGTVTYNADYAPISLLSRYIRPGDQSLKVSTPKGTDAIAVKNAERLVVFLQNNKDVSAPQTVELSSGKKYSIALPAKALCAVVFN